MATIRALWTGPGNGTAFQDYQTGDPVPAPPAGYAVATLAAYNAALAADAAAILLAVDKFQTALLWSPSKYRSPASPLDHAFFGVTSNVAIWVEDGGIGITGVTFKLDAVVVNVEASAPWDYFTTDGGGFSTRGTFAAGLHVVTADITCPSTGPFTLTANIEVE